MAKKDVEAEAAKAIAWLEKKRTKKNLENLVRFGITATDPIGVSMANLRILAKQLGQDHELAEALWRSGRYEARLLATLVDEPRRVTPSQMDRWCRDFDNWAITDTACFALFDKTPHAWTKIHAWAPKKEEFVRRAAFALLASVALHDKTTGDEPFLESLTLIERAAPDARNFVKKGVSWALRSVGERSAALHRASMNLAKRLAASEEASARFIGNEALRELGSEKVKTRMARKVRQAAEDSSSAAAASGRRRFR